MSKISSTQVALLIALVSLLEPGVVSANSPNEFGNETARLATFDTPQGETSFALSLSPQVSDQSAVPSDIVIYVDTSASQAGVFKRDSIEALKQLLGRLSADDRVKLVAVDIEPVELTSRFISPASDEMGVALEQLEQRVALGATDLAAMLNHSTTQFDSDVSRNKSVIYIGDGISRDRFAQSDRFTKAISKLVSHRISVSSYAIGPERDIEMMAALANNTGGNVFVDSDDPTAIVNGATGLAQTVHGRVYWPTNVQLPPEVTEIYPAQVPPLRTDRDTVLVGTMAERGQFTLSLTGEMNGQTIDMSWPLQPEESNIDFAFLPRLIEMARANGGATLPTLGSAGLREMARVLSVSANELAKMGAQALVTGDAETAAVLAEAALKNDPTDPLAGLLSEVATNVQDDDPFAAPAEPAEKPQEPVEPPKSVEAPSAAAPPQENLPPNQGQGAQTPDQGALILGNPPADQDEIDQLLKMGAQKSGELILTEEDRIKVINQRFKARVQYEMERARDELANQPSQAVERLKAMLDVLDQTVDLTPENRVDLRSRLESALMEARRRKLEFDDQLALAQKNMATAIEVQRAVEEYELREEQIGSLLNRFESLMDEGNYRGAEDVVFKAFELDPELPEAVHGTEMGRIAVNQQFMWDLRRDRQTGFIDALYQSEKSAVPFAGDPPLVFPDPVEWARKRALRAKYQDIRLTGNENDEKILRQLNEPANFEYDETPFIDVMDELRENYGINVVLDQSAREDSLSEDEPITFNVRGIRLKNALRLLLKEKNATYIVRDEVLRIISLDVANNPENFVTNVYNVGDLVAPRRNFGGGGFGGGGGGFGGGRGGGGFGGGGGGFGGGGGGFGGGRGGGGGGVFCIQDAPVSASIANPAAPNKEPKSSRRNQAIPVPAGDNLAQAWTQYFAQSHPAPARVRQTVRELMKANQPEQVVALINGAIQNDQSQPWMYEAMVLAMQVAGAPKSDVERALMSAVDLAGAEQDLLIVADYMVKHGMERRAIQLLKSIADVEANFPEPFVLGLRAAQKIDDIDGIQWATIGILSQAWPKHREVVKQAIHAADAVRTRLEKEGRQEELAAFNRQLDEALYRDVIVKVSWTGDADVDLYVEEPGGTICSRLNPRTTAGGVMMGDQYSSGSNQSGEIAEYYVLPRGFSGDYRLLVRKVWGELTAGKVTVAVYKHFRTDKEESIQRQITLGEKGTIVLFDLKDGRRTKPLEQHAVQERVVQQIVMNRALVAQQFEDNASSSAANAYYRSGRQFNPNQNPLAGRGRFVRRPGAVGYQPVITPLFEGATLSVNHATTADRLYVMVSASPFFSQILDVQVFNTLGSAQTATGAGGGVGGGGGGLGGGGGQGGGGGGLF